MSHNYLEINNISKQYDAGHKEQIHALSSVDLSASEGDFIAIVGNNAAGKSTLLNIVSGLESPTSGSIILDDEKLNILNQVQRARKISIVKQNPNDSVIGSMTLAENLSLVMLRNNSIGFRTGIKQEWNKEFSQLLQPLGMGLSKRLNDSVDSLSGGQKQTLALIMATLSKPKLLLLDEHTAALDPKIRKKILNLTQEIVTQNRITTLMVTHDMRQALTYGNRLIMLSQGRVILDIDKSKNALTIEELEKYYYK
jgi:putative ABC transport system ATP-binding protein